MFGKLVSLDIDWPSAGSDMSMPDRLTKSRLSFTSRDELTRQEDTRRNGVDYDLQKWTMSIGLGCYISLQQPSDNFLIIYRQAAYPILVQVNQLEADPSAVRQTCHV
jgi:hypothetical protein